MKGIATFCALGVIAFASAARAGQYLQFQGTFGNANLSTGPIGVAPDAVGNLYVVESTFSASDIVEFNSSNTYLTGFGPATYSPAITVAPNGSIYTVEGSSLRHYDAAHNFVGAFGSGLLNAGGLATDASSNVYVADSSNNRIVKLDAITGNTVSTLAPAGALAFSFPLGIAVDGAGSMYVADSFHNRIEIFDSTGTFVSQFSTVVAGHTNAHPISITLPSNGLVYITDDNGVDVFTTGGTFLETYDTGFDIPRSLTSFGNTLYVVDRNSSGPGATHNQIAVFTIPAPEPASAALLAASALILLRRRRTSA